MGLENVLLKRRVSVFFSGALLIFLSCFWGAAAGFTETGSLALPSNGNNLSGAVIDASNGFAYFGTSEGVVPASILKIRLSNLTLAGTITLNPGEFSVGAGLIDSSGFAYFGIRAPSFPPQGPGAVVKIRLSDFTRVGTLSLASVPGGAYIQSAVIDINNGFAYFGASGSIAKIRLSDFSLNGTISLPPPANGGLTSAVIDPSKGFAYFGVASAPGVVVKIRLSDFVVYDLLQLKLSDSSLASAVIDSERGFAYFGTNPFGPASIVRIRLSNFTRVDALNLTAGEDGLPTAVIDEKNGFAYFGTYGNREGGVCCGPATIVQVRLSDFTRVGTLVLKSGETALGSAVIDTLHGFAYFGTLTRPGIVVSVQLSAQSLLSVSNFFTDASKNPLSLDAKGQQKIDVVLSHGKVRSTNPGEILAWTNVTNSGSAPVQSLKLNQTLPKDWLLNPVWMRAPAAISVVVELSNATMVDIANQTTITVGTGNPQEVSISIANMAVTKAGNLGQGASLLLATKIRYGLIGTSQAFGSFPRNYTSSSSVSGWTEQSFSGIQTSGIGSALFTANAKVLGDVNGDGNVNIIDVAMVAYAYRATPGSPLWNPNADFDNDGIIDIIDLSITFYNYGDTS